MEAVMENVMTPRADFFAGRAPVMRGTMQWVIFILIAMNFANSIALLVAAGYGLNVIRDLGQKPPLIYVVGEEQTTVQAGTKLLHSGPLDIELRSAAWEVVRLIAGADSSNVQTNFAAAKQMMANSCRDAFEREVEKNAKEIMDLQVYRTVEALPSQIRFVQPADVPNEQASSLDRFDLLVTGKLNTYRIGTNELLMSGNFSYRIQLAPTERTLTNPRGVVVSRIAPFNTAPNITKGGAQQ